MPYRYLDDIATADIAFEAWAQTTEGMFQAAAEATMNVMVEDLDTIASDKQIMLSVEDEAIDFLLYKFLQEFIFYKDSRNLLLRVEDIYVKQKDNQYFCTAKVYGEALNPEKHALNVDIKAITFHRFEVKQTERGWEAMVVLDI